MSTWMIFCSIWAMFALCVVLFIRGAHPHIEGREAGADGVKVRAGGMNGEGRSH